MCDIGVELKHHLAVLERIRVRATVLGAQKYGSLQRRRHDPGGGLLVRLSGHYRGQHEQPHLRRRESHDVRDCVRPPRLFGDSGTRQRCVPDHHVDVHDTNPLHGATDFECACQSFAQPIRTRVFLCLVLRFTVTAGLQVAFR